MKLLDGTQMGGGRYVASGLPGEPALDHSHSENPTFHPTCQTEPPDESATNGQVFFPIRTNPPPPDHSDRAHPPHNPSVVGLIPTDPTNCRPHHLLPIDVTEFSFEVPASQLCATSGLGGGIGGRRGIRDSPLLVVKRAQSTSKRRPS